MAAHGVAIVTLLSATAVGHVPATFLGFGGLSLAVAVWKRHWVWGEIGVAASLTGAAALGNGWFALGLVIAAAAHQVAARRVAGLPRRIAQVLAAGLAGWAWGELIVWTDWSVTTARVTTAWLSGGIGVVIASAIRVRQRIAEWVLPWAGLAVAMTAAATVAAGGSRLPVGIALAGAFALWCAAAGMSAGPLNIRWLREIAAILALAAGAALGFATSAIPAALVTGSVASGVVAALIAVGVWVRRGRSAWVRPLVAYGSIAHIAAIIIALSQLPARPLLVAALAAAAIKAIALSVMFRMPAFLYAGVPMLLGAWVTFASEGLTGNAPMVHDADRSDDPRHSGGGPLGYHTPCHHRH